MTFNLFSARMLQHLVTSAGLFALSCFAFNAHAQNFPVNPNYNPVTPDYVEQEQCEISNDSFFSDSPGSCAELILFPEPGNSMTVRGYVDTSSTQLSIDTYRLELTEETQITLRMTQSHLIPPVFAWAKVPSYFYDCSFVTSTSPFQTYDTFFGTGAENEEFNFTLGPGLYKMAVGFEEVAGDFIMPCGVMEYQFELSHNGFIYMPGDLCELAIEVESEDTFNESRVMDDMANAYSFGDYGCAYDIGQVERWYKFTAEKTTSFISARREGAGNFNPVIEVYDACGAHPILCQDEDSGAQELVIFPTVPNQEYLFRVYHKGPQALNNTALSAAVAHVPTTQLRSLDCNRMNLLFTDIIRSDWPSNSFLLENWQFKFEMVEAPYSVYEITSPNGSNPQFRMTWFPQAEAGKTYVVSTRPKMYQGPTWGDYGSTCIIGTAPDFAGFIVPDTPDADFGNAVEFGSHGLKAWPNPAHDEVTFSFNSGNDDQSAQIAVFSVSGKMVDSFQQGVSGASVQNVVYQTADLPAGVYLVRVQTETGISTSKLVVSH